MKDKNQKVEMTVAEVEALCRVMFAEGRIFGDSETRTPCEGYFERKQAAFDKALKFWEHMIR